MPKLKIGVLIRFHNSIETLPYVFEGLQRQTRSPDLILGVNNASTDGSSDFFKSQGGVVIDWPHAYHHSKTLNAGMKAIEADLVMPLSSHTVLEDVDVIEKLEKAFEDPRIVCASPVWEPDMFYSRLVDWEELQEKGIIMGSIYSNSCGMLRKSAWSENPFDERFDHGLEDFVFAIERLRKGEKVARLSYNFRYLRQGRVRFYECTSYAFAIANHHGLKMNWLGLKGTLRGYLTHGLNYLLGIGSREVEYAKWSNHEQRLRAWLTWRVTNPYKQS